MGFLAKTSRMNKFIIYVITIQSPISLRFNLVVSDLHAHCIQFLDGGSGRSTIGRGNNGLISDILGPLN